MTDSLMMVWEPVDVKHTSKKSRTGSHKAKKAAVARKPHESKRSSASPVEASESSIEFDSHRVAAVKSAAQGGVKLSQKGVEANQ